MEKLQSICRGEVSTVDPASNRQVYLGFNAHYIVSGVAIREGKVLMVQKAKPSCEGLWYLPAGRMEKGETMREAVIREVKEESGMDFHPLALMAVDRQGNHWIRFTFTGTIVGGNLKTPQGPDSDSIQAQWLPCDIDLLKRYVGLRATDCIPLIKLADKWFRERPEKTAVGIVPAPHQSLSLKIVLLHKMNDKLSVLVKQGLGNDFLYLPGSELSNNIKWCDEVDSILKVCGYKGSFESLGIMTIEHSPAMPTALRTTDGACFTLLCQAGKKELQTTSLFHWLLIEDNSLVQTLNNALTQPFYCTQMMDIQCISELENASQQVISDDLRG